MYVDGFVIPIPKKSLKAYRKMAQDASKVWMDHGAIQYVECVSDDMAPKGIVMTFPKMAKAKPGDAIIFSWIMYKSKAHRDAVNKKVMKDRRITSMEGPMPFDMKRMAYGGFASIVPK